MQKIIIFLFLVCGSQLSLGAGCFENASWEQCKKVEGIEVCSSRFGESEALVFRGKAKIDSSLKPLAAVLYDVEHYQDWQINVKKINVLRKIVPPGKNSCTVERLEHSYGKKPWIVRWVFWVPDSDFVYKAAYELSPDAKHFALYLNNDESEDIPERDGYRRGAVQSCYILDSLENENETSIRVEIWVDLNIDIDVSRINSNLMDWPVDIIKGLRRHIVKTDQKKVLIGMNDFFNGCLDGNISH